MFTIALVAIVIALFVIQVLLLIGLLWLSCKLWRVPDTSWHRVLGASMGVARWCYWPPERAREFAP